MTKAMIWLVIFYYYFR